jgi:prepilin-type N-terminal cleavage/methylation domain-containing protein
MRFALPIVSTKSASLRRRRASAAFTLTEVMVACAILALISASIIWGLHQLNYYASVSRLYTAAQTLAQNQIDLVLTKAPYNPTTSQYPTPNVLQIGTYYSDPTTPNTLYATERTVPIYTDPSNGNQTVTGSIKTTVVDPNVAISGNSLNLRQATVVVTYTFRNKTFTVKMDTMRTCDS